MKKIILLSSVICLVSMGVSFAQDTQPSDLQVNFKMDFGTEYVWRGFNVYGSTAAYHPTLNLFCPNSGVGFSIEGHKAVSDYEATERWDYSLYYHGRAFVDQPYEMMYRLAYVYYNYPEQASQESAIINWSTTPPRPVKLGSLDLHELHAVLQFPKLLGVEGLVPSYALVKLMPFFDGTIVGTNSPSGGTASGFAHIFGLDYSVPYVCPITGIDRKLNLHSELVYNDGVGPGGQNVDHDWSNALVGASTDFDINNNISFTPALFYQLSFEESVNQDDQFWGTISLNCKF